MNIKQANNILIIRFSSLGDVLLTTPVLSAINRVNPGAKIDYLIKTNFVVAIKYHPHINNIYEFKKEEKISKLTDRLIENKYDFVIDLQNNFRSRKITSRLNIPFVRYKKPTIKKLLLVKLGINRYKEIIPIPQMYANPIEGISLGDDSLLFNYPETVTSSLSKSDKNIAFCVGAKHFTKRWPADYFIQLGIKLIAQGYKVNLLGGIDDIELCDYISANLPGALNLCEDNNLYQVAANMKACDLVFCNDSGLMHLAVALQVPVIAFFGSSVKEFGFAPYNAKNTLLENNSLSCRPCSHIGLSSCPKKHFDCMKNITSDLVMEEFQNMAKNL
ncbi:MAG: glycosyltransferase family 9 protein [Bacteroidetes bacterium]|nr:glycosyltransferase family 9 protein [Bacteroidota bacterium]